MFGLNRKGSRHTGYPCQRRQASLSSQTGFKPSTPEHFPQTAERCSPNNVRASSEENIFSSLTTLYTCDVQPYIRIHGMARIDNCFASGISSASASRRLFQPILETLFGNDHAQLLWGLDSPPHLENRHVAREYNRMKRLLYVERELATSSGLFNLAQRMLLGSERYIDDKWAKEN